MTTLESRLEKLESEVRRLRDERDLVQLMASYGPAVDAGASQLAADLWIEDGRYEVDVDSWAGRSEIAAMIEASPHQQILRRGCGHITTSPRLEISDDAAIATCHSILLVRKDHVYQVWRVSANRWEFERTREGWRVKTRTNRVLAGDEDGRLLLRAGFEDSPTRD